MIWWMKCLWKYIDGSLRLLAFPFLATLSFRACCSLKWSSSALRSRPGQAQIRPSNERLPRTCPLSKNMLEFSFNFKHNQTMWIVCMLLSCSSQLKEYISMLNYKYAFVYFCSVLKPIKGIVLIQTDLSFFLLFLVPFDFQSKNKNPFYGSQLWLATV